MKKWIFSSLSLAVIIAFVVGCQQQQKTSNTPAMGEDLLLSVDFKPDVPLKYKFVSQRNIQLDLNPSGKSSKTDGKVQSIDEKLEMEIVYKPVEIDPYGYSMIEASCISAKVSRSSSSGKAKSRPDAVETLQGKTFTLKITPTGKIVDHSSLEALIKELGEKAFGDSSKGRIKDPDMIMDFVATQWSIWDSVASIKDPLKGLKKGNKWNSRLIAPMPYVAKIGRDVEYKLDQRSAEEVQITSGYSLSESAPTDVPLPYSGAFQMRGTFGFLRGYQVLSIDGTGQQIFDVEKGLIKSDSQQYQAKVKASIFGLGGDTLEPNIIINQTITMTLVE